jgi:hypothetical protein
MLHAMRRNVLRFGAWIPFAVVLLATFAVACDVLKKDSADAAAVAPVVGTAAPATPAEAAPAAPGVITVPPLGTVAHGPTAPGVRPVGDAGRSAEAGAAVVVDAGTSDAGKAAPVPTPTFAIPTAFPGFDAGGLKPPPGFPSTLPTFPPPTK